MVIDIYEQRYIPYIYSVLYLEYLNLILLFVHKRNVTDQVQYAQCPCSDIQNVMRVI